MPASEHPYKIALADVPVDTVNTEATGWDDMVVKWIVTRASVGAESHVVGVTVFPPGARHHHHRHPNAEEAQYLIKGSGIARLGDVDLRQEPGDTVFVPRNEVHGFHNDTDEETVMIWTYGGAASLEEAGFVREERDV
jgi:quercetin dioxygenase-like cupin family protein